MFSFHTGPPNSVAGPGELSRGPDSPGSLPGSQNPGSQFQPPPTPRRARPVTLPLGPEWLVREWAGGKVPWLLPRSQQGDEEGRLLRAQRLASPSVQSQAQAWQGTQSRREPLGGSIQLRKPPHRHFGPASSSLTIFQGKCCPRCTRGKTKAAGWNADAMTGAPTAILDLKVDIMIRTTKPCDRRSLGPW